MVVPLQRWQPRFVPVLLFPVLAQAFLFDANAHAQIDNDQLIVDAFCTSDLPQEDALTRLRDVSFSSVNGFRCAEELLSRLDLSVFTEDTTSRQASDLLWNVVQAALVDSTLRRAASRLITTMRTTLDHPLRSEAWLAARTLRGDTNSAGSDYLTPTLQPTTGASNALLPPRFEDPTEYIEWYEKSHLLLQREIRRLFAQVMRLSARNLAPLSQDGPLAGATQITALTNSALLLSMLPNAFAETVADDAFKAFQLVQPGAPPPEGGSDAIEPMVFHINLTACPVGDFHQDYCVRIDSESDGIENFRQDRERTSGLETSSYVAVDIPLLRSANATAPAIRRVSGTIGTWLRGGHGADRDPLFNRVLRAYDTRATAKYTISGTMNIPQCGDPAACSTIVRLVGQLWQNNDADMSIAGSIETPEGTISLKKGFNDVVINRANGHSTVRLALTRDGSHTGMHDSAWHSQGFTLELVRPSPLEDVYSPLPLPPEILQSIKANIALPGSLGVGSRMARVVGLQFLQQEVGLGWQRIRRDNNDRVPLPIGERLTYRTSTYADRHTTDYIPLLLARLLEEIISASLMSPEKDGIRAARRSISGWVRQNYTGAVRHSLQMHTEWATQLDPSPFNIAIGLLLRGEPISTALDPAEAALVRLAISSQESAMSGSAQRLLAKLDELRTSNSKLDAVLVLHQARHHVQLSRILVMDKIDMLARELAQLELEP